MKLSLNLGTRMTTRSIWVLFILCLFGNVASASHHYTERQLDALASRVGRTFWVVSANGRLPSFLVSPSPKSGLFRPTSNQSFAIVELVGRKTKQPYFKVKFDSGEEAYLHVEAFHEEFNLRIVTVDPLADEKRKLAAQREEDKKRVAWIEAQPWSPAVKEAAIKRQVAIGMKTTEVKRVLGDPVRAKRIKTPHKTPEEHWFYADGKILIFQNRALFRIESENTKKP